MKIKELILLLFCIVLGLIACILFLIDDIIRFLNLKVDRKVKDKEDIYLKNGEIDK